MTEDMISESRHFTVPNPSGPDYTFYGECLADLTTHDLGTVRLYRTRRGRIVLRQRHSTRPGRIRIDRTDLYDTPEDALATLAPGAGLNAVRGALGLDSRTHIE